MEIFSYLYYGFIKEFFLIYNIVIKYFWIVFIFVDVVILVYFNDGLVYLYY